MPNEFNPQKFEQKIISKWKKKNLYKTPAYTKASKKKYCLDMFPYPSGSGLHVGHVEGYTATDIYSRYMRMNGYDVLHPMGWDSFGLPAENYAIKTKIHPKETTDNAIIAFKTQINRLGLSYDWGKEIKTSSPEYYKWTQWFFLLLYKNGLAYRKKAKVNWCSNCQTVLANEQAEGGICERCEGQVIQKDLKQWFFKITDFIEDQEYNGRKIKGLLNGLGDIDWPESTKLAQKNWIGRSEGAKISFIISTNKGGRKHNIDVFTTRPDTLFGCTFLVLCPEHKLIKKIVNRIQNIKEINDYIAISRKKTDMERTDLNKQKQGIKIEGIYAVNPANNKKIPVFVADYILPFYGYGAIMAVPAHDERDWDFAEKYKLPKICVIVPSNIEDNKNLKIDRNGREEKFNNKAEKTNRAYSGNGKLINSNFLNGLNKDEAQKEIIKWLEKEKIGKKEVSYKLRDWLVSRQRYWGAPIPIIYCDKCGEVPVHETDLPVLLPEDVDFNPIGESPLNNSKDFHNVLCPKCKSKARRESDTMDTFVCSSWYYFRFIAPDNSNGFTNKRLAEKWLPVDVYVGGAEHSVLHLLYSRFFTKVLQKYGYINFNEPFKKLKHPGTILAGDGNKMSKSKGNVINPDDIINKYGADCLRMYEMFMAAFEDFKPWKIDGMIGIKRFLEKIWLMQEKIKDEENNEKYQKINKLLHKTIKKAGSDIENFKFNTAISQIMILANKMNEYKKIPKSYYKKLLLVLAPFAPFAAEEIWVQTGNNSSIHLEEWPKYNDVAIKDENFPLAIQVNGKFKIAINMPIDIGEKEAIKIALENKKIKGLMKCSYKKVIFVKNKVLNFIL